MAIEKEKFEGPHYAKFNAAREQTAKEEADMIREVDQYLISQVSEKESYEEVVSRYLKDYVDFLDSSAVQPIRKGEKHKPFTLEQKLASIKRQIYMHEILPQKKKAA